ncbi:hypothetical protein QHH03_01495 [Aphanizomenon sp. 202]|uniref:MFS transporter n=1 Tax=Dolichospermum heterosporum TAC447 TaxID=747523 RepID=A0ABY5M0M0_9CYAN|nr:hypothetical protein [Dolichospermum heterosporum]MDK2407860.1 hypothetical protein [Aphanizomenon sp. 202]UUO16393.1 hypothetical protein NG743_04925 [Dolichospermum heterosporum TAC447]
MANTLPSGIRERTSIQPTNQDFFRFGQGIVTQIGFIVFTYLVVCQELIDG